jgi:hypothetical protein
MHAVCLPRTARLESLASTQTAAGARIAATVYEWAGRDSNPGPTD